MRLQGALAIVTLAAAVWACTGDERCPVGEVRTCDCPVECEYLGCGSCLLPAIQVTSHETCGEDGWGACECGILVEPDCAGLPVREQAGCSVWLRSVLRAGTGDITACRAAVVDDLACRSAAQHPQSECAETQSAMDQACLGTSTCTEP
jgi:hypothetical protein